MRFGKNIYILDTASVIKTNYIPKCNFGVYQLFLI